MSKLLSAFRARRRAWQKNPKHRKLLRVWFTLRAAVSYGASAILCVLLLPVIVVVQIGLFFTEDLRMPTSPLRRWREFDKTYDEWIKL